MLIFDFRDSEREFFEKNDFTDWGNQVLELCFDPGNGEYYMGDVGDRQREGNMGEYIDYLYKKQKKINNYTKHYSY